MAVTLAFLSWTVTWTWLRQCGGVPVCGLDRYRMVLPGGSGGGLRGCAPAWRCSPRRWAVCLRSRAISARSWAHSPESLRFSAWAVSSLRSSEVSEARWLAGIGAVVDLPVASRSCRICRQMSGWEYSQERDIRAWPATAVKVTAVPARSSSRIAWIALARVSSCRRLAAAVSGVAASADIGGTVLRVLAGLKGGDDPLEAAGDLLVHLHHPRLPAVLGRRDDLQGLLMLAAVPGEELGGGDEQWAGQAGVGVLAPPDQGQPAVAVGEGLHCPAEPLLGPGGLGKRAVRVQHDGVAVDIDLAGPFPVPPDGRVGQPRVLRGHLVRVV